jgi:hypothetical protein
MKKLCKYNSNQEITFVEKEEDLKVKNCSMQECDGVLKDLYETYDESEADMVIKKILSKLSERK